MTSAAVPASTPQDSQPSWTVQGSWYALPRIETSFSRKVVIAFCLIAATFMITVPLVVLLSNRAETEHQAKGPMFCKTEDCDSHGRLIQAGLDHNVRPCDNFASFVCGKASKEDVYETLRFRAFTTNLRRLSSSSESKLKSSAVTKAKKLFYSCLQRNSGASENGLEAFKNFTRRLRIPWPDPSPEDTHPLDVLLDLAVNWAICIWIKVEMYRTVDGTLRVILMSRCDGLIGDRYRPWTDSYDHYRGYIKKYCDLFKGDVSCMQNAEQLQKDEEFVRNSLAVNRSAYYPVVLPLENMKNFTPSIPSGVWVHFVNKHFEPYSPFRNYRVLARDWRALPALDAVFAKLSPQRLLTQIAWTFVQTYAWVAAFPSFAPRGDEKTACLTAAEDILGLLPRAEFIYSTFPEPEREKINRVLDSIGNVTLTYVQDAGWLQVDHTVIVSIKLTTMQINAWPTSEFFNMTALDALYSDFPGMTEDFFSNWILSRQALVSKLKSHNYSNGQLYDKRYDTVYGLFSYLNYVNVMDVSLSAFQGPLFYSNGTAAINYAGLGGRYATEFLRGLYDVYPFPTETEDGGLSKLFPSDHNNTRPDSLKAPTCVLQGSKSHPLFPFVPALQVAHKAFRSEQLRDTGGLNVEVRLQSLKELSADKIFFMTFCRALCHVPDVCNTAVSNSAQFASAFDCPQGAPMNPTEKCSFFQEPLFSTWK